MLGNTITKITVYCSCISRILPEVGDLHHRLSRLDYIDIIINELLIILVLILVRILIQGIVESYTCLGIILYILYHSEIC